MKDQQPHDNKRAKTGTDNSRKEISVARKEMFSYTDNQETKN
jgi:hypothetical protein